MRGHTHTRNSEGGPGLLNGKKLSTADMKTISWYFFSHYALLLLRPPPSLPFREVLTIYFLSRHHVAFVGELNFSSCSSFFLPHHQYQASDVLLRSNTSSLLDYHIIFLDCFYFHARPIDIYIHIYIYILKPIFNED